MIQMLVSWKMVLSHAAENEIVKNTKLNTLKTKANNLGKKIPDATTLTHINKYITNKQNSEKKQYEMLTKINQILVVQ